MSRLIPLILLSLVPCHLYSQWIEKNIGSNLVFQFPSPPECEIVNGKYICICKTESCYFTVVEADGLPAQYYPYVMSQSNDDKKYYINKFLDGIIESTLLTVKSKAISNTPQYLKGNIGREISFYAKNPVTKNEGLRYMRVYYVPNSAYIINCLMLNQSQKSISEKNKFFNSIKSRI